ncbi:MAG TPA: DUF3341 domain-containing protein [Chloroflexota bacterium]
MAEFTSPDQLLEATRRTVEAGYTRVEAYSPLPVEGLAEALRFHTKLPLIVLIAGAIGGLTGFFMQYWMMAVDEPLNIGGRPLNSWPAWIPVTFELTVLFAGITAVVAMIALNRLPQPYHPVFNVSRFNLASDDRFFLAIEAADPKFDQEKVKQFMNELGAADVHEVEP